MSGGGGSSSGGTSTTITKNEPPEWIKPYSIALMQRGAAVSDRPYEAYGQQRLAGIDPYQQMSMDLTAARALSGSPLNQAASQNVLNTLNGQYMNSNPYLDQMFNTSAQRVTDAYRQGTAAQTDAAAARGRNLGGSAYQQQVESNQRGLGDSLAALSAQTYGQNYENERNRQLQAWGAAPGLAGQDYADFQKLMGVGDINRQYNQDLLNQRYQDWTDWYNYPLKQLDVLGNTIGLSIGNSGTTMSTAPNPYQTNPFANVLGAGLMGAGLFF